MKLDYDEVIIFEPKRNLFTKILCILIIFLLSFCIYYFASNLKNYYFLLLFFNLFTVIIPFYIISRCVDRLFSNPEKLLLKPLKNFGIKFICFLVILSLFLFIIYLILNSDYKLLFFSSIPLVLIYGSFYKLFSKVILTNKRIIYQNIFFIKNHLWLKDIVYIAILHPLDGGLSKLLHDIQNIRTLSFKVTNKLLPVSFDVPEPEDFKEKTIEHIESNIKNNNLNQELMKKTFLYKIGVYNAWANY